MDRAGIFGRQLGGGVTIARASWVVCGVYLPCVSLHCEREREAVSVCRVRSSRESCEVCASSPATASSGGWLVGRRVFGGGLDPGPGVREGCFGSVWRQNWSGDVVFLAFGDRRCGRAGGSPAQRICSVEALQVGYLSLALGYTLVLVLGFPWEVLGSLCLGLADALFWVASGGSGVAPPPGTYCLVRQVVVGVVCCRRPGGGVVRCLLLRCWGSSCW